MSDVKLGQIIQGSADRDAIHIAIAPVTSDEFVVPGEHVGIENGKASSKVEPIGIVDPFLKSRVEPGQRFYLCLYQQTVTGMKHLWSHPSFPEQVGHRFSRSESEAWLRRFCETNDCPGYEELLMLALDSHDSEYLHCGTDAHGNIPPEFWDHIEAVSGTVIPQTSRAQYFSCSC